MFRDKLTHLQRFACYPCPQSKQPSPFNLVRHPHPNHAEINTSNQMASTNYSSDFWTKSRKKPSRLGIVPAILHDIWEYFALGMNGVSYFTPFNSNTIQQILYIAVPKIVPSPAIVRPSLHAACVLGRTIAYSLNGNCAAQFDAFAIHIAEQMGLIPWKKSTSLLSNVKTMLATFSSCLPPLASVSLCPFLWVTHWLSGPYACMRVRMCWCMLCARVFVAFHPKRVAKAIAENCEMC